MVLLGDEAQVVARFGPLGDSANLDARYMHGLGEQTIGSKIYLDAPYETSRRCGSGRILFLSIWRWC
jgi:hypothetical protein